MMIVIEIVLWLVFAYMAFQVIVLLFLAVAGLFPKAEAAPTLQPLRNYLVLIPSYKEDRIILETARKAKELDYPASHMDITIIADKLLPETIHQLRNEIGVRVIEVQFVKSTKARSIKFALQQFEEQGLSFDSILILDADNFIQPDCLQKINASLNNGYKAVQLHRIAKNKNTPIAFLDAISEEINNHLFRKGMRNLGFSAAIIGSGMALQYTYFKHIFLTTDIENNPGEDKELEEHLLRDGFICDYIPSAFVLDEKVQSLDVLENQRVRWISAQLGAVKNHFFVNGRMLFTTNLNYVVKAFQYLLFPRVFLLFIINFLAFVAIVFYYILNLDLPHLPWYYWVVLAIVYNFLLLISIPRYFYKKEMINALLLLPSSIWAMAKALKRSKFNQRDFIHTVKNFKD